MPDDQTIRNAPSRPKPIRLSLTGCGVEQQFSFNQGEVGIGRGADCDVKLVPPSPEVQRLISRHHARLLLEGDAWVLENISVNGTALSDAMLTEEGQKQEVADGDVIGIEEYKLLVSLADGGDRTARPDPTAGQTQAEEEPDVTVRQPAATEEPDVTIRQTAPEPDEEEPEVTMRVSSAPQKSPQAREKLTELKRFLHTKLIRQMDLWSRDIKAMDEGQLRNDAAKSLAQILEAEKSRIPVGMDRRTLTKEVLDEAIGLGPLEELLADPEVTEIMVVGHEDIFVESGGQLVLSDKHFSSDGSVRAVIERIVSPIGRRIDESQPLVDARLHDGSRVNAVIPPLSLKGPCITIRKFSKDPLGIDDLIGFGTLNERMAKFMERCVVGRKNIVISGGTGSGKTTLLNVLSSFIPEGERIVTIEDAAELQLRQRHLVTLQSRPPNIEGKGEITIRDLVKNALRMRPDRIVIGECRGSEALDMLQAMNTGHDGSLTTGHANSPEDMVRRLEVMTLMAGEDLPVRAIREQMSSAIDVIVQQIRFPDGARKITHISEVAEYDSEEDEMIIEDIFTFRRLGHDEKGRTTGEWLATGYIPSFMAELIEMGVVEGGDFL